MKKSLSLFFASSILMLCQSCFLLQKNVSVDEPETKIYSIEDKFESFNNLKVYEGKYTFEKNPSVKTIFISSNKEKLFAEDNEQVKYELVQKKDNKDVFLVPDVDGQLTFVRNDKKSVTGVTFSFHCGIYLAKKDN
jgi:hypothetical protein